MAKSLNPAPILRVINTVGNLLGATVAFFYLRVIDRAETNMMHLGLIEIAYSLLIVATLIGIGQWWSARWLRPIARIAAEDPALPEPEAALGRRRALLFPYFLVLVSFSGWTMAGLIQGLTKDFKVDILISEATRKSIGPAVSVDQLPAVRVKGRAEEVNVYRVV